MGWTPSQERSIPFCPRLNYILLPNIAFYSGAPHKHCFSRSRCSVRLKCDIICPSSVFRLFQSNPRIATSLGLFVREGLNEKKTFYFGHCSNYLTPPPHDPNSGNLLLFFSEVEIQDLTVSLELKILYNILHISNLKNC